MKSIKFIVVVLIVSFVLNLTGVVAYVSDISHVSGYKIPAWKGVTSISNKNKREYGSEVIQIVGTSYDRDIQFQIYDRDRGATANYQTLSVGSGEVSYAIGRNTAAAAALSISAMETGVKTLNLKTAGNWLSETSFTGAWWLSLSDWEQVYGKANISGSDYTARIK